MPPTKSAPPVTPPPGPPPSAGPGGAALAALAVVFGPDQVREVPAAPGPPGPGPRVVVVAAVRTADEFADACADLRDAGYEYDVVRVLGLGRHNPAAVEAVLAQAVLLSHAPPALPLTAGGTPRGVS